MATALEDIDRTNVVGVDDPSAAQSTHDLGENVYRHFAPGKVPSERGHRDRHRGVDVATRDPSRDPRTQGEADGESEVDRQSVL